MLNRFTRRARRRFREALFRLLDWVKDHVVPAMTRTARTAPLSHAAIRRAMAWVCTHRSAAGIDGVAPAAYSDNKKRADECRLIHRLLSSGRYRFTRAKLGVQKRKGKPDRRHAIATVRDAVVLRAITFELRSVWEQLPRALVGHRPGTNYARIIREIARFIGDGPGSVLRFDLRGAFASTSFEHAIQLLAARTSRADLIELIASWRAAVGARFEGVVEGSPIGPLLLAVVLASRVVPNLEKLGGTLFVWGDDGVLMLRDRATVDAAYSRLVLDLADVGLACQPQKTGVHEVDPANPEPTPWAFIGFEFRRGQPIPCSSARTELVETVERLVRDGTENALANAQRRILAFAAYFAPGDAVDVFADLDEEISSRCGFSAAPLPSLVQIVRRHRALRGLPGSRAGSTRPGVPQCGSGSGWRLGRPYRRLRSLASAAALMAAVAGPTGSASSGAEGQGRSLASRLSAPSPLCESPP